MINGKKHAWEDITITLPHGTLIDVQDIEYNDKMDAEAVYGKGSNPVGYSRGNYSADGKLTVLRTEYDKLIAYAKSQSAQGIYRMKPFPITVSWAGEDDKLSTDTLPSCIFTERKRNPKQGDKGLTVEMSFLILNPIEEDGYSANDDSGATAPASGATT